MGFPAPEQPEQAIDDAEYDLAVLGELLRLPAQQRAGGLRYLLSHHEHLARALRFRARRWSLPRFSAADGFVAQDDASRALLAAHQLSVRAYSPSSLALVAACPYRFFLHSICGVRERASSAPTTTPDARERGVLMHSVQQAVFSQLRSEARLPLTAETLPAAQQILRDQFERLAAEERERRDPSTARVLDESLRGLRHDLEEWLRLAARPSEWQPLYFELAFGVSKVGAACAPSSAHASGQVDEQSVAEPVLLPGLKLSGVVDLVERHVLRDERGRMRLRVTDYKSSLPEERMGIVSGGRLLQPLLYALALERLFTDAEVVEGVLYFCTTRADFLSHLVPLDARARAVFAELVSSIDSLLKAGFLPAAPRKDECSRCPYLVVCGPYEEKERVPVVKAKDLARLAPLFRLRNLP
jgi:ATP-dependent helicase/nuclease subunit B